jgi:predicted secreted hydrolase
LALAPSARADYPPVLRGRALTFPGDHGAHPDYRTEWWYVTGWLADHGGAELGVQVTFFRNRPRLQENNPSAFAPKQLLFAHAAIAEPRHGRLRHDQRAAREGFGLAFAAAGNTDVRIDDWSLRLESSRYRARIASREFDLDLAFDAREPVLLQGQGGFSRKGPRRVQASYYYSLPQLAVSGRVSVATRRFPVSGRAWLDHEWSSEIMDEEAAGWDWTGINLEDGGALMAFRMRDAKGGVRWAAGTLRDATGAVRSFAPGEIAFAAKRRWRSPRTGVEYPVGMRVRVRDLELDLEPLMDDQELDARASTGTIYWEGAVRARRAGRLIGRGYLELTGYWNPVRLY